MTSQHVQQGHIQDDGLSMDPYVSYKDQTARSRKWKSVEDFKFCKSTIASDIKSKVYKSFSPQVSDSYFSSGRKTKSSQCKIARKYIENGGQSMEHFRCPDNVAPSEETEFNSFKQVNEDADFDISNKKSKHSRESHSIKSKLGSDEKVGKSRRKDNLAFEVQLHLPEIEIYTSMGKRKGQINEPSYHAYSYLDEKLYRNSADFEVDNNCSRKLGKVSQMHDDPTQRLYPSFSKSYSRNKRKGKAFWDYYPPLLSYMEENDMEGTNILFDGPLRIKRPGKNIRSADASTTRFERYDNVNAPLITCNSMLWKLKGKADVPFMDSPEELDHLPSKSQFVLEDSGSAKKKGKRKGGVETVAAASLTPDVHPSEMQARDIDQKAITQQKSSTLITPTVDTDFSFSIIHLLSAVRLAMIASTSEDIGEKVDMGQKPKLETVNGLVSFGDHLQSTTDAAEQEAGPRCLPSLTIQKIVDRIKLNPGDPCILETQEPHQDLVRGVLRIFSSKTAPLGAKGWKPLVSYEKATKSWTWVGPVASLLVENDPVEEETSASAWAIPHRLLVKLVDAFANWLKNCQEILKQIGSLPDPPTMFMTHIDEKERFRDLRAQKSLTTINPSSDVMRAYFRKEEYLRYMIPDRAFSYTAFDGRKSMVASLRRCGGKPFSKARDHFMLKSGRPAHVTILCLVRDAASRLPGSIGTRADVCTLIRDSQYVVEDVSDAQVNQVVSGALDRLHYERDPCVHFDAERKLWVYLHRDRLEEDFEDDGTSSTKNLKRPRKGSAEQIESRHVNNFVACQGSSDQVTVGSGNEYELGPEFIPEPPIYELDKSELVFNNLRPTEHAVAH